jgi:hypothetical protein
MDSFKNGFVGIADIKTHTEVFTAMTESTPYTSFRIKYACCVRKLILRERWIWVNSVAFPAELT